MSYRPTRLEGVVIGLLALFLPVGIAADVCAGRSLLGAIMERGWYTVAMGWLWFLSVTARGQASELRELREAVDRKPVGMRVELVAERTNVRTLDELESALRDARLSPEDK